MTLPKASADRARYHHGALRAALVEAAETLLREQGIERFTLRECARRAGVSHAAPAHHFGDARGLLSACAGAGFERLADAMEAEAGRCGDADAVERLQAIGRAYIAFALANRPLFQLMFRCDRLDLADPALEVAGRRAGDTLRRAIDELIAERSLPAAERRRRSLLAWSLVHGYATLVLEGQTADLFGIDAAGSDAARAMGGELLRIVMGGLAAAPIE